MRDIEEAEADCVYPATGLSGAIHNASLGQVVGRKFNRDLVAGEDADIVLAHLAGDMGRHGMTVFQLDPEYGIRQGFGDRAFHLNDVVF